MNSVLLQKADHTNFIQMIFAHLFRHRIDSGMLKFTCGLRSSDKLVGFFQINSEVKQEIQKEFTLLSNFVP